jgi:hypothetical protein
MRQGLVDFSVAECVKHFDCGGKVVFLHDFIDSGDQVESKSGKINKPSSISIDEEMSVFIWFS